jgi:hypothetical protein
MTRSLSVLTVALVLLSATSVGAQEDYARNGPYVGLMGVRARERFKTDVRESLNDQLAALGYTVDAQVKGSFGIKGHVGYRIHRHLSAEVEADWLFAFEGHVDMTRKGTGADPRPGVANAIREIAFMEFEAVTVTGNLKAHLLTGLCQPFLLVGGGMMTVKGEIKETGVMTEQRWDSKAEEFWLPYPSWPGISGSDRATDFALRFGGGLDLYSFDTDTAVITAEANYVLPFGDVEEFDYVSVSLGFQYRF